MKCHLFYTLNFFLTSISPRTQNIFFYNHMRDKILLNSSNVYKGLIVGLTIKKKKTRIKLDLMSNLFI